MATERTEYTVLQNIQSLEHTDGDTKEVLHAQGYSRKQNKMMKSAVESVRLVKFSCGDIIQLFSFKIMVIKIIDFFDFSLSAK
jgi:hypothetical protein